MSEDEFSQMLIEWGLSMSELAILRGMEIDDLRAERARIKLVSRGRSFDNGRCMRCIYRIRLVESRMDDLLRIRRRARS